MPHKIFIAGTGQNSGKTTVSFALIHLAGKKYKRVGYIKPLGPKLSRLGRHLVDKDAALMAEAFGMERDLELMSPVLIRKTTTRDAIDGKVNRRQLERRIVDACRKLEKNCDFLIIEGAGHPGVGSVLNLSNARIARLLDASVLMVTGGGVGNVVDAVALDTALFEKESVEIRALLINKLLPDKRDLTLDYLQRVYSQSDYSVLGGFNYQPILANPTLNRIARILDLPLRGERSEANRIVHHVQIGAPSTQRVAELLKKDSLVIVTSSRDELLVTMANLYQFPEYRQKIAGLLIPGVQPISGISQQILDRSNIPYIRTRKKTTGELYRLVSEDVSKLTAADSEKLDLLRELAELRLDFDSIDALFAPRKKSE